MVVDGADITMKSGNRAMRIFSAMVALAALSACAPSVPDSAAGVGFGSYGDTHVRFSLIENEQRTRQALRGIKAMFRADAILADARKAGVESGPAAS